MISKDQSIVTQVAAKIASELVLKTADVHDNIMNWVIAFDAVNEALQGAHGNTIEHGVQLIEEAFPGTSTESYAPPRKQAMIAQPSPLSLSKGSVEIAGKQHGDLPNWLITACQKAGVARVWDNRDQAVGTKRPWFKQADNVDGAEAVAFWPPKGSA